MTPCHQRESAVRLCIYNALRKFTAEMLASLGSYASAPRCSADKTYLQKIRFIDIFDCYSLFTDCRRKCFKSTGPPL